MHRREPQTDGRSRPFLPTCMTHHTSITVGLTVTLASDGRGDVALEAGALVLSDQVGAYLSRDMMIQVEM